jgi:hypothetical protein
VLSVSEVIKNAEGKVVELKATSKKLTETEKPQVQQRLSSTVPHHAQGFHPLGLRPHKHHLPDQH